MNACSAGKALSKSDPWGCHHFCDGRGINLDLSGHICISVMAQKWEDSVGRVANFYERQVSFSSLWHHESAGLSSRFKITL